MDDGLEPHVSDVVRALGNKVSREEVARELDNYIRVYKVSLDEAKRSIVKKFGGASARFEVGVDKKLSELNGSESNVNLLCRIVTVNRKDVDSDGVKKEIFYGILGDETMTVPFTAWETEGLQFAKGDVIRVQNAYTKEWKGRVQVYFGSRASIAHEKADVLPAPQRTLSKLGELDEGARGVSVVARILSVDKKDVEVDGKKKHVFSGMLGDDTGKLRFSAWKDFGLKADEVVRIDGAYVKSWRGILQLNFDENSGVKRVEHALPSKKDILESGRRSIGDLEGGADIVVEGMVVEVMTGSGIIYRCPECNRATKKGACTIHGNVKAVPDLRIKAAFDDGTGALTAVFKKELTEKLLKKDLKQCLEETRESPNPELIKDELARTITIIPMRLRGNVLRDDFGLTMLVDDVEHVRPDPKGEAREILEDIGYGGD